MADEHHLLLEKAREQMRAGRLTWREPDSIFGRAGSGKACAVCSLVIPRDHLECEIEISRDDWGSGKEIYHFHPRCYLAWDVERTKR